MNSILLSIQSIFLLSVAVMGLPSHSANREDTLVLLHVLFRHGNRSPDRMSLFPNDIHSNETYSPYGFSQLTKRGKQTEYNIGKYLRNHYGKFIPAQYTPEVIYALSTNVKRTKMSLELVLAGLFPPQISDQFEPYLDWQPIPFNVDENQGPLTIANSYCLNYVNAYLGYVTSDEAQNIIAGYRDLYEKLSTYAGFHVKSPGDAGSVYFTLKSEEDFGLSLPDWASDVYPEIVEEATSVYYEFATATPQLRKLSAGFLLRKIIEDSYAKQNGSLPEERKVFLYSAHEWNVGTILNTLNVFWRHVPPFGATVFFEIHNINGVLGLKLFYQNYKAVNPIQLTIPGCDAFCPLDRLTQLIADSLPGPQDVCSSTAEMM